MPGWAFHNIIRFVEKTFRHRYDIYHDFCIYNPATRTAVHTDLKAREGNSADNLQYKKPLPVMRVPVVRSVAYRLLRRLNRRGKLSYDGEGKFRRVHPSNRYDLVVYLDYYMDRIVDFSHVTAARTVKGIYTDGFPPKGIVVDENTTPERFCKTFLHDADAVVVGSPGIKNTYSPFLPAVYVANMAYDETLFVPKKRTRSQTLVLGWSGNPDREFKGYHQVIVPVVTRLRQEGYDIELRSRFSGPFEELPAFWQNVDLAVIASEADAGPSLFMEASLCGVPSISTRIGMPALVIRDGENGLFCDRSEESLSEKIKTLYHNRALLEQMASAIRSDYVRLLGTEAQKNNWEKLFGEVLV